jgi:hypothetical protein
MLTSLDKCRAALADTKEALASLTRMNSILKKASAGTIRGLKVTIARQHKDLASMRSNWASVEGRYAERELAVKEWESRTGLELNQVLKGIYGQPWGIYSHRDGS